MAAMLLRKGYKGHLIKTKISKSCVESILLFIEIYCWCMVGCTHLYLPGDVFLLLLLFFEITLVKVKPEPK
jgi:hypothetical protein